MNLIHKHIYKQILNNKLNIAIYIKEKKSPDTWPCRVYQECRYGLQLINTLLKTTQFKDLK